MALGSRFGVLKTYADTGSRCGSPIWHPIGAQLAPNWRPSGAPGRLGSPTGRPRGPSQAQEAPKRLQDEPQRRPSGAKLSPRGAQEVSDGAQKVSQKAPGAAKRQSKSTWRAKEAILEKVAKVQYCRAKLKVRGALEGHLEAKLEPKMASKCALAAQLGVQVRLGSPTWRPSAPWQPNLAFKWTPGDAQEASS